MHHHADDGCIVYDKLLTCLVMMTLSTECLTYQEKREKVERARRDRKSKQPIVALPLIYASRKIRLTRCRCFPGSAKIAVAAVRCWAKQQKAHGPAEVRESGWMADDPKGYTEALETARNMVLDYTCFKYKRSVKKQFDLTTLPTWPRPVPQQNSNDELE